MRFRRQLPAYSPIPASAALAAAAQLMGLGDDPRPRLATFLQREYDTQGVLLCRSGTHALTIAIREACDRVSGSTPVALPAFSCYDVGTAAIAAGVSVTFYDLDPQTLSPDSESLERVLRAGARIVVLAPLYGVPVDWDALSTLAKRHGAILIEDAAQGSGALWKGRRLGTLGQTAVLSFGRGKGWTGGHGGAFLKRTGDNASATTLVSPGFSDQAWSVFTLAGQWALGRPAVYGIPSSIPALGLGETSYRAPQPERALGKAAAAALMASHEAAEREARVRRVTAEELLAAVSENSRVAAISIERDATPGYLRLPVRVPGGMSAFRSPSRALALGISPSYPSSLPDLPQLAARNEGPARAWPGAQALVSDLITLPTHSRLRRRELTEISAMLTSIRPRNR